MKPERHHRKCDRAKNLTHSPVLRWALYEAGKTHARASAPDHRYYA